MNSQLLLQYRWKLNNSKKILSRLHFLDYGLNVHTAMLVRNGTLTKKILLI